MKTYDRELLIELLRNNPDAKILLSVPDDDGRDVTREADGVTVKFPKETNGIKETRIIIESYYPNR